MVKDEIINRICQILHNYFHVSTITEKDYSLGLPCAFGLGAVSLIQLYILIQESFEITIQEQQLQNYGFNSIDGIYKIVADAMS